MPDTPHQTPTCPKVRHCRTFFSTNLHHSSLRACHSQVAVAARPKADREDLSTADRKVLSRLVATIKKEERNQ